MRFERLHIPAFGPFTDLELNFPVKSGDLHVIYGPNEAGKSSLLRAFRDLLFGIHGQSSDNFKHDYKKMRIMAEITNQAGQRLVFQRRKGNKDTLLDADGKELPDNTLVPFLGSVDQKYFSTMFGLGAKELREGAEQLLHGSDELGNALFSASMGGTPVQKVLAALMQESAKLFKGRATANVSIRPAANAYKELLRKSREAIVSPDDWEKMERDLAAAVETKVRLDGDLSVLNRDLDWIARCEDAFPAVGCLIEETQKLAAIPALSDVSSDFVERVRTARKSAGDALAEVTRLTIQKTKRESQLADCQTDPALLAEADALERLHQDLAVYRDRKRTLADLATDLAGLEEVLRAGMQSLNLTGEFSVLETLRLSSAERSACEESAKSLVKAVEKRDKNKEKTEDIQTQIKTLEMQMADMPEMDLADLRSALAVAAEATDANKTLPVSESEVTRLTQETTAADKKLTGAPTGFDETANLLIPGKSAIRRFDEEMAEIDREMKSEKARIRDSEKEIKSLQAELGRMERRGELPSEEALRVAREHRDHGWSLVLADWKGTGSKEVFEPDAPLEEAFPKSIVEADHIADQLRAQADAVAQAEEKRFQIGQVADQKHEAEGAVEQLHAKRKESLAAWEALWQPCGIKPLSPTEMEEWREEWTTFTSLLRKLRDAEQILLRKRKQVQEACKLLAAAISGPEDKDFARLYNQAVRKVREGEESSGRKIELANQLHVSRNQLEPLARKNSQLVAEFEESKKAWEVQCRGVGLPETIAPQSGLDLLAERKELLAKYDRWKEVSAKSERTAKAVLQYETDVSKIATALGAAGDTVEAQERDLWNRLATARDNQARYKHLKEQIAETTSSLEECLASSSQAERALEDLVHLAKLETAEALEPLLANLELRDHAQGQIDTLRGTLSGLARGQSVDDFIERVRVEDSEALFQRKEVLQREKQEREASVQAVRDKLYALNEHKKALEAAGDVAADFRQQAESCAARLSQDAMRFVRLRLATHFLQTQIERFRKENQGPLLEKSGVFFRSITRGAFDGLGAEFNADDTPILVGVRPDKTSVPISGMSDGTRDQLYLSLRMAALERYLEAHEPMPLIMDDLLITFDNDRAAAILPRLSSLAKRTQIVLFTHHDHLVDLCRRTLGEGSFQLHQL